MKPSGPRIRQIPIERINPAPYNPRKDLRPGDPEYEKLARSIDEFGNVEALVWNRRTGHLVGGHQRLKILVARGVKEVIVSEVNLPLAKEKVLNVALNKISGDWDREKLAELLEELMRTPDLDLGLTGFDPEEAAPLVADFLAGAAGAQDCFDVAAELEAQRPIVTRPGDLILLGRDPRRQHRLLCGDSTDAETVRRLMGGERAALFATDPPYLVGYDGTNHQPRRGRGRKPAPAGAGWDDPRRNEGLYERFIAVAVGEAIRPEAPWYCWHASRNQSLVEAAWAKAGAIVHQQIVWVKERGVLGRSWYLWSHEPCLMGWVKGRKPRRRRMPAGGPQEPMLTTVWAVPALANGPERPDHLTPKPLELFAIPIRQHTLPGEVCYEPFAGSGTQIIAAQQLKRRCFAIEISPRYCDVIVRRFIAMAGEAAVEPRVARRYRLTERRIPA